MSLDWEAHRDVLEELYLDKKQELEEVRKEMKQLHSFDASKNQYVAQFKKWQWRKNITKNEWEYIGKTVSQRKMCGRDSEVYFNNARIPDLKVRKEISRNFLPKVASMPSPPTPLSIRIRTPPSALSGRPPTDNRHASVGLSMSLTHKKRKNGNRLETNQLATKRPCNSIHKWSERTRAPQQSQYRLQPAIQWAVEVKALPYFEFLDYFRSLDFEIESQPLLQGNFSDTALSPVIFPARALLPADVEISYWELGGGNDDGLFGNSLQCFSNQRTTGQFYRSFADLLVSGGEGLRTQDELDHLLELQEGLPSLLANMPEREKGEIESNIQTLLGPPQLSAGLRLLETVIYLYSNNLLDDWSAQSNFILQWIVDTVPFQRLSAILRTKLPTIQAFQTSLTIFGVVTGRLSFVRELLSLDIGLEATMRSNVLLREAIRVGNAEMVELLLAAGSDVRSSGNHVWRGSLDSDGFSIEIARLLSNAGADICSPVWNNTRSPLLAAVHRGDAALVHFLIRAGADVNKSDGYEDERYPKVTLLKIAVHFNQNDILKLLLENGADVHAVSKPGRRHIMMPGYLSFEGLTATPLQAASAAGDVCAAEILLRAGSHINEPAHGDDGMTALQAATHFGHIGLVELLLQNGADANALGTSSIEFPRTALLTATEKKNVHIVKLLLQFGAETNCPELSRRGISIIGAAKTQENGDEIISLLLAAGAEEKFELSPLQHARYMKIQLSQAILRSDVKRVQHLANMGVTFDMEPIEIDTNTFPIYISDGVSRALMKKGTILHWAIHAENVNTSLFRYLVQKTHNINDQNANDIVGPVLHSAVSKRRLDLVVILLDAGADVNAVSRVGTDIYWPYHTALFTAVGMGDEKITSLLLDRGADVNFRASDGNTPLQEAFGWRSGPDVAELLISRGADVHAPPAEPNGHTALQGAVRRAEFGNCRYLEMAKYLVTKVNVNETPSKYRNTALQEAAAGGNMELVILLLAHGADVNAPATGMGATALQAAAFEGHIKIAQTLLNRGADINAPGSPDDYRALNQAAVQGRLDMVQLLINAGADQDLPLNRQYCSALKHAEGNHRFGIVSLLQKYRDEAMDKWDSMRILENDSGD